VFFDNEYDSCFNDPSCTSSDTAVTGDGDSMSGGPGMGDGDGDGGVSGGRSSGGGTSGAGGDPSHDGSGGKNDAGGADSGGGPAGDGGAASGGDTGVGGVSGGSTRLVVNELRIDPSGFVEIYNASKQALDLTHFALTTGTDDPNWASLCPLSGSLVAGGFLEVTSGETCRGQTSCIKDCPWMLSAGDRAYVLYAEQQTFDEIVDDRVYPSGVTVGIGQSYSATSDGSSTFVPREQSPGVTNGQE